MTEEQIAAHMQSERMRKFAENLPDCPLPTWLEATLGESESSENLNGSTPMRARVAFQG